MSSTVHLQHFLQKCIMSHSFVTFITNQLVELTMFKLRHATCLNPSTVQRRTPQYVLAMLLKQMTTPVAIL